MQALSQLSYGPIRVPVWEPEAEILTLVLFDASVDNAADIVFVFFDGFEKAVIIVFVVVLDLVAGDLFDRGVFALDHGNPDSGFGASPSIGSTMGASSSLSSTSSSSSSSASAAGCTAATGSGWRGRRCL
jgi:hypothetical protein